ncbi:hypothetical protein ACFQU1_23245 [Chelatococcus sp. GCM10030263]|uniref:hypothetical protein n=1 Tax=Chelatococcus sp. GCM10030263 TaxID=3273387 RepID=UPI003617BF1C
MYDVLEKSRIPIRPALEVYLPPEDRTVRICNVNDAIDCICRILRYETDTCWTVILKGLYTTRTFESAENIRGELRREFLLRGMTLPEDASSARPFRQRAQMWLSSMIDGSSQLEIELSKPARA